MAVALAILSVLAVLMAGLALTWVTDLRIPGWWLAAGLVVVVLGAAATLVTLVVRDQREPVGIATPAR